MDSEVKLKVVGKVIIQGFSSVGYKDGLKVLSLCMRRWGHCMAVSTELVFQVMRLVLSGAFHHDPLTQ